jgi:hypothetical protein
MISGEIQAINTVGYPGILAPVKSKNPTASTRKIDTSNHKLKSHRPSRPAAFELTSPLPCKTVFNTSPIDQAPRGNYQPRPASDELVVPATA